MKRADRAPQPNGWEKSDQRLEVQCTETEKLLWKATFGRREVSSTARRLLNVEAARLTGVPPPSG